MPVPRLLKEGVSEAQAKDVATKATVPLNKALGEARSRLPRRHCWLLQCSSRCLGGMAQQALLLTGSAAAEFQLHLPPSTPHPPALPTPCSPHAPPGHGA